MYYTYVLHICRTAAAELPPWFRSEPVRATRNQTDNRMKFWNKWHSVNRLSEDALFISFDPPLFTMQSAAKWCSRTDSVTGFQTETFSATTSRTLHGRVVDYWRLWPVSLAIECAIKIWRPKPLLKAALYGRIWNFVEFQKSPKLYRGH